MSNGISGSWVWAILLSISSLAPAVVLAQPASTGEGEVSLFGGGSLGIGNHPMVGGSSGVAISRYGMMLVEASYQPLGSHTIRPGLDPSTVRDSHLWNFDLDFHIRIPVSERWQPYGIAGVGLLWDHFHQDALGPQGNAVTHHVDQFNAAFVTGGGLQYQLADNWGIRPQIKVIVSKQTYVQMSIGIYYVLSNGF